MDLIKEMASQKKMEINFENEIFAIDIEKVISFIYKKDESAAPREHEIIENYEMDENGKGPILVNRTVRDGANNQQNDTIKYDLIKTLISYLLERESFDTEKNKYIFDIFYRNPYKELQRLCLEFELCKDKLLNNLKDIQEEIVEKLYNILFT